MEAKIAVLTILIIASNAAPINNVDPTAIWINFNFDIECPDDFISTYFMSEKGVDHFYNCFDGSASEYQCPFEMYFDFNTLKCISNNNIFKANNDEQEFNQKELLHDDMFEFQPSERVSVNANSDNADDGEISWQTIFNKGDRKLDIDNGRSLQDLNFLFHNTVEGGDDNDQDNSIEEEVPDLGGNIYPSWLDQRIEKNVIPKVNPFKDDESGKKQDTDSLESNPKTLIDDSAESSETDGLFISNLLLVDHSINLADSDSSVENQPVIDELGSQDMSEPIVNVNVLIMVEQDASTESQKVQEVNWWMVAAGSLQIWTTSVSRSLCLVLGC